MTSVRLAAADTRRASESALAKATRAKRRSREAMSLFEEEGRAGLILIE
jgi:hypothetical protein